MQEVKFRLHHTVSKTAPLNRERSTELENHPQPEPYYGSSGVGQYSTQDPGQDSVQINTVN